MAQLRLSSEQDIKPIIYSVLQELNLNPQNSRIFEKTPDHPAVEIFDVPTTIYHDLIDALAQFMMFQSGGVEPRKGESGRQVVDIGLKEITIKPPHR